MPKKGSHLWGVILAGGEGKRLREFIRETYRLDCPKQYCALMGTRSMLRHTIDRCERLISRERLVTIVARQHLECARPQLSDRVPGTVLVQPCVRDTAPSLLYSLMHIHSGEPNALVAVFPSDHFVAEEDRFMECVRYASRFVGRYPQSTVLLGAEPKRPETEYGWIEFDPLIRKDAWDDIHPILQFTEKPAAEVIRAIQPGHALWNTMVVVSRTNTLLEYFRALTPELYDMFRTVRRTLNTPQESREAERIFEAMRPVNFSEAILAGRPPGLWALRMPRVTWSDWGNVGTVQADIRRWKRGASVHTARSFHDNEEMVPA